MADLVDDPDAPGRTVTAVSDGSITEPGGPRVRPHRRPSSQTAVMLGGVAALAVGVALARDSSSVPGPVVSDPAPSAARSYDDELLFVRAARFAGARDVPVTVASQPGWHVEDIFVSKGGDGYGLAFYEVVKHLRRPLRVGAARPTRGSHRR